jgi:hypothetical protein
MEHGKRSERRAVTSVERLAALTPRKGRGKGFHGGRFTYVSRDARGVCRPIRFEWDAAAKDSEGRLVVVEAELDPALNAGHIHGHLNRLPLMARSGDTVSKVIWVVRRSRRRRLTDIVSTWMAHYAPLFVEQIPQMEVRTPEGELMPWAIDRRSK